MVIQIVVLLFIGLYRNAITNEIKPDNIFSIGDYSYNVLTVDLKSTSLYVGGHDYLFRLWLYNVNNTASSNLHATRKIDVRMEEREECLRMGNSEEECKNQIRLIFLKSDGHLLLCSSNAMKPQLRVLDGYLLIDLETPKTIIGICSPHENLNTTAVYAEEGNYDNLPSLYSGIQTGLALENHLIYRPPLVYNDKEVHPALRSIYTDPKWLNEPQFVGSFSIGEYVYFFFREFAVEAETLNGNYASEYSNNFLNNQVVYSRVARICKNDLGGGNVLRQVWSSFVKARLNCSINLSFPTSYYFDYIQAVFKLTVESDTYFYATFTSPPGPFQSSAICVYSLNAINQIFDSKTFLEQSTPTSIWSYVSQEQIPKHRPGKCTEDSRSLSDKDLNFAKNHLIMAESVQGELLTYRYNEILTKIVVDKRDDKRVVLFVLSPHLKTILKIRYVRNNKLEGQSRILAKYNLSKETRIVHDMVILPGEYLYFGESNRVSQYRLSQCELHLACGACAADPYCSWNVAKSECFSRELIHSTSVGWITSTNADDAAEAEERCQNFAQSLTLTIYPGDSIHLKCNAGALSNSIKDDVNKFSRYEWLIDRQKIIDRFSAIERINHLVSTKENGLVLLNITNALSGTYQCFLDRNLVIEYTIVVDDVDCAKPKTIEQFRSAQREWCKKYNSYKSKLLKWQNWYEKNESCSLSSTKLSEVDTLKYS